MPFSKEVRVLPLSGGVVTDNLFATAAFPVIALGGVSSLTSLLTPASLRRRGALFAIGAES